MSQNAGKVWGKVGGGKWGDTGEKGQKLGDGEKGGHHLNFIKDCSGFVFDARKMSQA